MLLVKQYSLCLSYISDSWMGSNQAEDKYWKLYTVVPFWKSTPKFHPQVAFKHGGLSYGVRWIGTMTNTVHFQFEERTWCHSSDCGKLVGQEMTPNHTQVMKMMADFLGLLCRCVVETSQGHHRGYKPVHNCYCKGKPALIMMQLLFGSQQILVAVCHIN